MAAAIVSPLPTAATPGFGRTCSFNNKSPVTPPSPTPTSECERKSFLSALFGELPSAPIPLVVKLPSGSFHQCIIQPSYTVDQVKLLLFRTCPELTTLRPSDFILAAVDNETNGRTYLEVEFLKIRKLSKSIVSKWKDGNEIHLSLLHKAGLTELQHSPVSFQVKRTASGSLSRQLSRLPSFLSKNSQKNLQSMAVSPSERKVSFQESEPMVTSSEDNKPSVEISIPQPLSSKVDNEPHFSDLRRSESWKDREIQAKVVSGAQDDELTEVDWDELSVTLDTEVFEGRLEHLEEEVEEQRRLRKQLEEQVQMLQTLLNRTPAAKKPIPVAPSVIVTEPEHENDLVFKKLQEGLNQMSEVLKETATKFENNSSGSGSPSGSGISLSVKKPLFKKTDKHSSSTSALFQRQQAIPQYVFKLERIKDDFLKTEQNFMNRILKTIIEVYYDPLVRKRILSSKELRSVFLDIQPFYQSQKQFFQRCNETRYATDNFAQILRQRMNELEEFDFLFVRHHTRAVKTLKSLKRKNKQFKKFMRERENKNVSIGLDLSSLLVKPVSHMASYKLLLERYLHTIPDTEEAAQERKFVSLMLEKIHNLLETLEVQRDQEENVRELLEIQDKLAPGPGIRKIGDATGIPVRTTGGNFDFNKTGRRLLRQGKMLIYDSLGETKSRHFVLCNDVLVILRPNKIRRTFSIIKIIPLQQAEVGAITIPDQKHAFLLASNHPFREIRILVTDTEFEKQEWMKWIQEAAAGLHNPKSISYNTFVGRERAVTM